LPGLSSNHNPPDFCPLSSWDYGCELLHLALNKDFWGAKNKQIQQCS
jgi:hypothetical protein